MPPTLYQNMKRTFRIVWKSLVTLVVIGLLAFIATLKVWEAVIMILAIIVLCNSAMLLTPNRNLAKRNLRSLVDGVIEDYINIKTWITK